VLIVLKKKLKFNLETDRLILETCPEPVQVMPASEPLIEMPLWENPPWETPFWILVVGNVFVGALFLAGLFSVPAWLSGLFQFIY